MMNKVDISNNFFQGKVIVSYDPDKTWVLEKQQQLIFCKKTNDHEVRSIKKISKSILNKSININNKKYFLCVPKIYNWDSEQKVLYTEFCRGKNLEFLLRNKNTYKFGSKILNEILDFLITNRIYWIDFAPRNILIGDNIIYLVDFEKGIASKNIKLYDYFRNHVYEEYCLFLFPIDRKYDCDFVFNIKKEKNNVYLLKDIESNRIKEIAHVLGYKDKITKKEYLDILKMLILVEEPKIINNEFYFSSVYLDQIFADKKNSFALNDYAQEVVKIYATIQNKFKS